LLRSGFGFRWLFFVHRRSLSSLSSICLAGCFSSIAAGCLRSVCFSSITRRLFFAPSFCTHGFIAFLLSAWQFTEFLSPVFVSALSFLSREPAAAASSFSVPVSFLGFALPAERPSVPFLPPHS
jgi:hypothetical protein